MTVPFMATSIESAMPAETMPAPALPKTTAMALDAGRGDSSDPRCRQYILHGRIHQHVQDANQGHAKDERQRKITLRVRTSPETMFRSFQPS